MRRLAALLLILFAAVPVLVAGKRQSATPSSSAVLAQLPEGDLKRQFIIDCTNCHQFGPAQAYPGGRARTRDEWLPIIDRMHGMAGPATGFPVMSGRLPVDSLAGWLATYLRALPTADAPRDARAIVGRSTVREFMIPAPNDLPHDIAIDSSGTVIVTGMFTSRMYLLDTITGGFDLLPIPVPSANPRAVEVAANGDWWVLLGGPHKVARYSPSTMRWTTHDVGMYAHSVALTPDGRAWYNGHFTQAPEMVGYVDGTTGATRTFAAPLHPTRGSGLGGPIPYELRAAPDGRLWMSELQGHRMLALDPRDSTWQQFTIPGGITAPRRFDVDEAGVVWIPLYAGNAIVRLDPRSGEMRSFALPRADAVPYIARVHRGTVWIGTNASDEVYAFDIAAGTFTVHALPSRGAVVRHLVVDPRNGDVWLAYGASPGIPARIARLRRE